MKNKKLILPLLALNAVAIPLTAETARYEKLYNKIERNLDTGKSNNKSYKLIESILKKRNKELKKLYLQSDYIVKPEYLEWQIFFTGFYSEKDNGKKDEDSIISVPKNSNTINLSIKMPGFNLEDINIDIDKEAVSLPSVKPEIKIINMPEITYNSNINIPEFSMPKMVNFDYTPPTFGLARFDVYSSPSSRDKTFYNPDLTSIQTWNSGLFSNYNIESGDFIYKTKYEQASPVVISTEFSYDNAVGTIDPTAILESGLNQPSVIPVSDSNIVATFGHPMIVSTSSPNIRIGEDVNISVTNTYKGGSSFPSFSVLMRLDPVSPNRSALNADSEYAYGGSKQYFGSAANVPFSIMRNSGTVNMDGSFVLAAGIGRYSKQSGARNDYVFVNDGTIIGNYTDSNSKTHIGMAFSSIAGKSTIGEKYVFINDGKMEFRAPASYVFTDNSVNIGNHYIFQNRGEISMYGANSNGIQISNSSLSGSTPGIDNSNEKILLEKPINIQGDKSIGAYLRTTNMKLEDSILKINIGTEKNLFSGNVSGNSPDFVENSVALYLKPFVITGVPSPYNMILRNYDLKFGDYAKNSVLIYNGGENTYNITNNTLTETLTTEIDNSVVNLINIDSGQNNIAVYNDSRVSNSSFAYLSILSVKPDISVGSINKPVNNTIALYNKGGIVHLAGDIESYGYQSHALYNTSINYNSIKIGGILDNEINGVSKELTLITNGENSTVLYNKESNVNFVNGGTYKALGNSSSVFYNAGGNIKISGNALLEADNSSIMLYSNDGLIDLNGDNIYNVKNGSVFAITEGLTSGIKINLSGGNQTLNLENGGIGFLYDGDSASTGADSISNYLNSNFSGLNNLNINIADSESKLFILNNYGVLKLSDLSDINEGTGIFKTVTGAGNSSLNKGTLELDTLGIINLDDPDNVYGNTNKILTGITVNADVIIKGTESNQTALGGKDTYRGTPGGNTYVIMTNKGAVELSGDNSVGIYTNNGIINNISDITSTGNNSAGIFGENSTVITNNGNVNISNNGVGIYAVSYQDPLNPETDFGNGLINVTNNGLIKGSASENGAGIYVNNNKLNSLRTASELNLSNGTVDMGDSENSVGVYAQNTTVSGGGIINIGESGIGFYAKQSDLNLTNLTLNMNGSNTVGFYLDDGTNLNMSGTNTVNISGNKNTIFYINTNGLFNQNIVINADSNADYSVMVMKDKKINYEGTLTSNGGTLFYGDNSSITLNDQTVLESTGSGTVGIYVNGLYNSGNSDYEGVNLGEINFNNSSAGLYGVNGARLINEGGITVGDDSVGINGENSLDIKNSGSIIVNNGSIGILGKNSSMAENTNMINSSGDNSIGMYLDNTNGLNSGEINLTGEKTTGVYALGTGNQTFINTGNINTGSSDDLLTASVGIYALGSVLTNSGNLSTGEKSLGIYGENSVINHTGGKISSDTGGIGVYSVNSTVNLSGGELETSYIGVYGKDNTSIQNTGTIMKLGDNSLGYVLKSGSTLTNNQDIIMKNKSVYVYSNNGGNVENKGSLITMTGSGNIAYYMDNSGNIVNSASIDGLGTGNIGIYSNKGTITNTGAITLGDSEIIDITDINKNHYSIGIYAENADISNSGDIKVGKNGVAVYGENNEIINTGEITSDSEYAVGLWGRKSTIENNNEIVMNGNYSQGILGTKNSIISNNSIITMNGDYSTGINADEGSKVYNNGTINLNGNESTGILLSNGAELINTGIINMGSGANNIDIGDGSSLIPPSIINAGVIKVDGKFQLDGINLVIKVDPSTIRKPEIAEIIAGQYSSEDINAKFLESNAVHFKADSFDFSNPAVIDSSYTQGTNADTYKFEDVFMAKDIESVDSITADSMSASFTAVPSINEKGNVDIWMKKIPYVEFTKGTRYNDLAKVLDENYVKDEILSGQTGDALKIYDKLDLIADSVNLTKAIGNLTGEVYSNMNQRDAMIGEIFENSLDILRNSKNNTKENIKVNVIAGKGKSKEKTQGVSDYDYTATGVHILREVERTYKHTFGYSLGYVHTNFEFEDGNESEEQADTIQLGLHNKYMLNDWELRNDLTGKIGIYNIDRKIGWGPSAERTELNGTYETYSISSDNRLGKELLLGKNGSLMPYGGIKATYMTRPTFSEKGLGSLEVKRNDAWSITPKVGMELKTSVDLGTKSVWKLKGSLDVSYNYELADLNERESVRLTGLESNYRELSKPEKEKGTFKTKALAGIEAEDRYGIYITGEYSIGNNDRDDYRAGVTLKAVF